MGNSSLWEPVSVPRGLSHVGRSKARQSRWQAQRGDRILTLGEDRAEPATSYIGRKETESVNDTPEKPDQPEEPPLLPRADDPEPSTPGQEEIVTQPPVMMPPTVAGPVPRRQGASCLFRLVVGLCLILSLASLTLSGLLLYSLINVRQAAMNSLDAALEALEGLETRGFHYEYQFSDRLPIAVEVPVQEQVVISVQENLSVNTDVKVPIDAGVLGTFVLDVPIDTSFPLDVEVPVEISETVAISTSIPLSLTVPIDIRADDPAIQQFLAGLQRWLLGLRESFEIVAPLRLPDTLPFGLKVR